VKTTYEVRHLGGTIAKRETFKDALKVYEINVAANPGADYELVSIEEKTLLSTAEKLDATVHAASRRG